MVSDGFLLLFFPSNLGFYISSSNSFSGGCSGNYGLQINSIQSD